MTVEEKKATLISRLSSIFSCDPDMIVTALSSKPKKSLRFLQNDADEKNKICTQANLQPISWCPNAFYVTRGEKELIQMSEFAKGVFNMQNASSLLPPLVLNPLANDQILDMCAAPGIKASMLGSMVQGLVFLDINEQDRRRYKSLLEFLKERSIPVRHSYNVPGQYLPKINDIRYSKILIDAPCSGEGMLNFSSQSTRMGREVLKKWNLKRIKELSNLQRRILSAAVEMLAPGGELVYSTCTFAPEENEAVVNYVLEAYPDLTLEHINIKNPDSVLSSALHQGLTTWNGSTFRNELTNCIRIFPNEYLEGFFVARLRKEK